MKDKTPSEITPHFSVGKANVSSWRLQRPLPVKGCLIIICERGEMDISINSNQYAMHRGDMAFIVFDMVTVPLRISDDFRAKFVAIDFVTSQDLFFLITSNRFWEWIYACPLFTLSYEIYEMAAKWFAVIDWVDANCSHITAEKVLHNEMENFMLVLAEHVETHHGILGTNPSKNRAWMIANEFLGLLKRYYTHHHDVAFYAGKLNITPNYLNMIAKQILGISAKKQINMQLVVVVKMLLDTTDLTVKEISENLHYDDPSYLCKIFRKHTGLSPIQYRNRQTDKQDT